MHFPEGLENTPFKWKIFSNFVFFSECPNFNDLKIHNKNTPKKHLILLWKL